MSDYIERELDDLSWVLVPESKVKSNSSKRKNGKSLLTIVHLDKNKKHILSINIQADIYKQAFFHELVDKYATDKTVEITPHKLTASCVECSCLIKICENHKEHPIINDIFSALLITGRPLRHYSCTFFLPLDLYLNSELEVENYDITINLNGTDDFEIEEFKTPQVKSILDDSLSKNKNGFTNESLEKIAHIQAVEFFNTSTKEQIFDIESSSNKSLTPIKHYRIKNCMSLNLELSKITPRERKTMCKVEDVSIYQYYNGMFLLGLRVSIPENQLHNEANHLNNFKYNDDCKKKCKHEKKKQFNDLLKSNSHLNAIFDDKFWWQELLYGSDKSFTILENLQVNNLLSYTKITRVLYANFFEQLTEKKIANLQLCKGNSEKPLIETKIDDEFSNIIIFFIKKFFDIEENELTRSLRLNQIADERMFAHVSYVLIGKMQKTDTFAHNEFKRLYAYGLYVDEAGDGYDAANKWPYDQQFTQNHLDKNTIARWQSISNLIGTTDYSTVAMGFGGFMQNPISSVHIPYIYAKIQILILFYKLTLEHFDRKISVATADQLKNKIDSDKFKKLNEKLIEFTNHYWIKEFVPQIQGKEISELMTKQQKLSEKYENLQVQMERSSSYSNTLRDAFEQEKSRNISIFSIIISVLLILPNIINHWKESIHESFLKIPLLKNIPVEIMGEVLTPIAIPFILFAFFKVWKGLKFIYNKWIKK